MALSILLERGVGETRAVALDSDRRPFALFCERHNAKANYARWGDVHVARLAKISNDQGGGFAVLDSGEDVFLRRREIEGFPEGAKLNVCIEAEARRGKYARGSLTAGAEIRQDPFAAWKSSLPNAASFDVREVSPGNRDVQAAFDEALSPEVTLPSGGALKISETPALIAIDVDTAGRRDAGRAYDRALAVNLDAVKETARQLSLRGLGGLVVIDCVAPLRTDLGARLKSEFVKAFRAYASRRIDALKPSRFGLLEASLAWQFKPIAHMFYDEAGNVRLHSRLLEHMRMLECELIENRSDNFRLSLPPSVHRGFANELNGYSQELSRRYGARFEITDSESEIWVISPR